MTWRNSLTKRLPNNGATMRRLRRSLGTVWLMLVGGLNYRQASAVSRWALPLLLVAALAPGASGQVTRLPSSMDGGDSWYAPAGEVAAWPSRESLSHAAIKAKLNKVHTIDGLTSLERTLWLIDDWANGQGILVRITLYKPQVYHQELDGYRDDEMETVEFGSLDELKATLRGEK